MNSVLQKQSFVNDLSTYEEWLAGPADETGRITNADVINGVVLDGIRIDQDNRPSPHWLNPFTATQDEIDRVRAAFKKAVEWRNYVASHIPTLNPDSEYQLKISENEHLYHSKCGHRYQRLNDHGQWTTQRFYCNRPHVCEVCRGLKEKQFKKRLNRLAGYRYLIGDRKLRAKISRKLGKDHVYTKHIDLEKILIVVDDDQIGQVFTKELAKEFCNLPPKGCKSSGNLGKEEKNSYDGDPDDWKEYEAYETIFKIDAPDSEVGEIFSEAESIPVSCNSPEEVQSAVYAKEDILKTICKNRGVVIFRISHVKFRYSKNDSRWNDRRSGYLKKSEFSVRIC